MIRNRSFSNSYRLQPLCAKCPPCSHKFKSQGYSYECSDRLQIQTVLLFMQPGYTVGFPSVNRRRGGVSGRCRKTQLPHSLRAHLRYPPYVRG
jgi:hypothetical protein